MARSLSEQRPQSVICLSVQFNVRPDADWPWSWYTLEGDFAFVTSWASGFLWVLTLFTFIFCLYHISCPSLRIPSFPSFGHFKNTAMGLASPITDRLWALANYSASYAYPPLVTVSRSAIGSLFQQIKVGQLTLIDADGTTTICGQQKLKRDANAERSVYSLPVVELKVNKELFWVRLLLFADMVRLA